MHSVYDAAVIRAHTVSLGQIPLIDINHRRPKDERAFDPHEAQRYKERSAAERVNSQLKDNFGGRFIRSSRPKKSQSPSGKPASGQIFQKSSLKKFFL